MVAALSVVEQMAELVEELEGGCGASVSTFCACYDFMGEGSFLHAGREADLVLAEMP